MTDVASKTRAEVIEGFAETLRELREAAGSPSFREMAGRSKAISHTTLHEAAQGHRFPSWPTTAEFVKACGGNPGDYRARWDEANKLAHAPDLPAFVPSVITQLPDLPAAPADRPPRDHRMHWAIAGAVAVVVAVAVVASLIAGGLGGDNAPDPWAASLREAALPASECPVVASNPPTAPPANRGDEPRFIDDVTLPDCTHVGQGQTVLKVWRLKNVGTVHWKGYSLRRLDLPQDRHDCQTIADVPIDDTAPGQFVDVKVEVTTPKRPTFCYVRFKMLDASGQIAFPGNRPVNFQVIVD